MRSKQLYEKAIEMGDNEALNSLALLLSNGTEGVEVDAKRAKELFEAAIEKGSTIALFNLAELLNCGGDGVEAEPARAKDLYERYLERSCGDCDALERLGIYFLFGAEGIPQNISKAKLLFEEAVSEESSFSKVGLGVLLLAGGEGVERNIKEAKRLFECVSGNQSCDTVSFKTVRKFFGHLRHALGMGEDVEVLETLDGNEEMELSNFAKFILGLTLAQEGCNGSTALQDVERGRSLIAEVISSMDDDELCSVLSIFQRRAVERIAQLGEKERK